MEPVASPPPPPPPCGPTKVVLTIEDKETLSRDELLNRWNLQQNYIKHLEVQLEDSSKPLDEKLKVQQQESSRRENVLMMRLATKEQDLQEVMTLHNQELKQAQIPSVSQLQSTLIDPAVNLLFEKMKTELTETKEKLEQAQNDLSAWKFTSDSVTGKKLMAKCRMLIQENQELGKQLSQGRIAELEAELSLQKKYSEELKASQDEMSEFVIQLDQDMEGMEATICTLQQQLKDIKQQNETLQQENEQLKQTNSFNQPEQQQTNSPPTEVTTKEDCEMRTFEVTTTSEPSEHLNNDVGRTTPLEEENSNEPLSEPMLVDNIIEVNVETEPITNGHHTATSFETNNLSLTTDDLMRVNHSNVELSPPRINKGAPKTSFSINDLLATSKDVQEPINDNAVDKKDDENGTLNGEIDDSVI